MSNTLKQAYDIIKILQNTSGSNAKKEVMEGNRHNEEFRLFLYYAYEPTICFYQTKVEKAAMNFNAPEFPVFTMDCLDEIIAKLAEREITGGAAINWLANLADGFEEDWGRELLGWLIGRDIKAGISDKTINKVWPKLITHVPYMRCTLPKHVDFANWPWADGVYEEIKYDGMYGNTKVYRKGDVHITSRAGSEFPSEAFGGAICEMRDLSKHFLEIFPSETYIVFMGEYEMLDPKGNLMPRKTGNGKFNSMLQKGEIPVGHTPQYKVWDFVPGSFFEAGIFRMKRKDRLKELHTAFAGIQSKLVEQAKVRVVRSYEDAQSGFKAARKLGLEGTITKHPESIWEDGTSKGQVKMKAEATVDLVIKGFNAGTGKNAALWGSMRMESSDGKVVVDVNGRDDAMRLWFHENRENVIGKVMAVLGNELIKPEKEGRPYSIFLPRFDDPPYPRADKFVADDFDRIKAIFDSVMDE